MKAVKQKEEQLLTEVQRHSGLQAFTVGGGTLSSARAVPYAERYRQLNGVYETPIERIQRAAEDEEARQGHHD